MNRRFLAGLSVDQLHALWSALQQFVDNNDPDGENGDDSDRMLSPERHEAAKGMLAQIDRYMVSINENPDPSVAQGLALLRAAGVERKVTAAFAVAAALSQRGSRK